MYKYRIFIIDANGEESSNKLNREDPNRKQRNQFSTFQEAIERYKHYKKIYPAYSIKIMNI